jgi:hypothetical protein
MSTMDDMQEVVESLGRTGTRYRVEKLALIGLYLVITATTVAWVFAGGRLLASRYAADFRVNQLDAIGSQTFYLTNVGTAAWEDVRVVLDDTYLKRIDHVKQGERIELKPRHFHNFYRVPRHWGAAEWEQLTSADPQRPTAPGTVEVSDSTLRIGSKRGAIDINILRGSDDSSDS